MESGNDEISTDIKPTLKDLSITIDKESSDEISDISSHEMINTQLNEDDQDNTLLNPNVKKKFGLSKSMFIKSSLYGGLDGLTTVFVSVATIFSGKVAMLVILIIGVAKLVSGAISMGIGDFMSSKADVDLIKLERSRELWECSNYLKGETKEMVEIYHKKGLKEETAKKLVEILSSNKIDVMMVQELGLKPYADTWLPYKSGLINFLSFIFYGMIPLYIYIIMSLVHLSVSTVSDTEKYIVFSIDVVVTFMALIFMGFFKSRFSSEAWWKSIIFTLIVGIIAGGSGWLTAFLLQLITGLNI